MVTNRTYIVGTRGSRLALAQTQLVVDALRQAHPDARLEVREIITRGDRDTKPLSEIGGQGVFTKAIEDALLRGEIDIAVHSMKDLPPRLADGLTIAAVPRRGDPRDAIVTRDGRSLADLPPGARIGTGSARRSVQLKALRPDVECVDIRGNVDTRLRKLDEGQYDAIVVAKAGLDRLGLGQRAVQVFTIEEMTPSPGQGALAVQVRTGDDKAAILVALIDDEPSHATVTVERAYLEALGADCKMAIGAHASLTDNTLETVWLAANEGQFRRSKAFELPEHNEEFPYAKAPLHERLVLHGKGMASWIQSLGTIGPPMSAIADLALDERKQSRR